MAIDFDYTGEVQTTTLKKGKYKIECWGAQGGSDYGGKGGYSVGTVEFTSPTTIYIYVGGQGTTGTSLAPGGFNGGGACGYDSSSSSGGGGTDVRVGTDSLYARLIVAGGGGGYSSYSTSYVGGVGGGTSGGDGTGYYDTSAGKGATQTAGGATATYATAGTAGSFGTGGAGSSDSSSYNSAAGGGGGWYGGGGSGYYDNRRRYYRGCGGAGGGSGYVYTSSTASNYPSGCLLNSTYYLTDANTTAGSSSITSPTGETETGHTGNGYVRITVIASAPDAPDNLGTTFSDYFSATLVWDAIENVSGYKCKFNGATYSTTNNNITIHGLTGGSSTSIEVWAYNSYGDGDYASLTINVPLASIKQTLYDYQQLTIKWNAATYATGYIIKRDSTQIATLTDSIFTDTGLLPSHSYTYELYTVRDNTQALSGSKIGKTEEGGYTQGVVFDSVNIEPNPTTINTSVLLTVKCEDKLIIYKPEKFFSNEIYSGEV